MSVDRLILDFPETIIWIEKHNGEVRKAPYRSAKRAVEIKFDAGFAHATKLFKLPGLRRALIAYWSETLADMRERNAKSTYAGFHCSDAIDALLDYKRATEKMPPSR